MLFSLQATSALASYFINCEDALKTAPFSVLRKFFEATSPLQQLDKCMRLTNSEFLVTGNPRGQFDGDPSNFFYCNVGKFEPTCVEDIPASYYPSLGIVRQFSGPNNKQYVLWKTSSLRHGVELTGYHIFSLAPKTRAPRGYEIYALHIGTYCSYDEGVDCPCDNLNPDTKESIKVDDPVVVNEGQTSVALIFETSTTDCSQSIKTSKSVIFELKNSRFVLQ